MPHGNSTRNCVKVVQRLPAGIRLNPNQQTQDLRRPGASVQPSIAFR